MRSVNILPSAQADLVQAHTYIAQKSGSRGIATRFIAKLRAYCRKLGQFPGIAGRARPELRPDIRSLSFGNYVIFLRYVESGIEIINILEGHRDIDAFFEDE